MYPNKMLEFKQEIYTTILLWINPPPLRKTRFRGFIFFRFRFRKSDFGVLFFSNFGARGFIFFRFWARGFIFFRFPGSKSSSKLNPTFPFSPLEIAFWTLKTPIFFRLRRAKFRRWGFIFFKISPRFAWGFIFFRFRFRKSDFGVLFFSDFSWKMPLGVIKRGGYSQ